MSRKLFTFIEQLENLTKPLFMTRVKEGVARGGLREIARTFASETDPYGNLWPDTKQPKRHILVDTGELKSSFVAEPTSDGVRFYTNVPYAPIHQYGTSTISSRKMLPVAEQGLGSAWRDMADKVVTSEIKKALNL